MAAPNLYAPTNTVTASTAPYSLTTSETAVATNAASSNSLVKVSAITVANISTSGTVDVTLRYYSAASGGTGTATCVFTIPVGGSLIIVGVENRFFLVEDRRITLAASANSAATAFVSTETVST